jgi:hypothetical protein
MQGERWRPFFFHWWQPVLSFVSGMLVHAGVVNARAMGFAAWLAAFKPSLPSTADLWWWLPLLALLFWFLWSIIRSAINDMRRAQRGEWRRGVSGPILLFRRFGWLLMPALFVCGYLLAARPAGP